MAAARTGTGMHSGGHGQRNGGGGQGRGHGGGFPLPPAGAPPRPPPLPSRPASPRPPPPPPPPRPPTPPPSRSTRGPSPAPTKPAAPRSTTASRSAAASRRLTATGGAPRLASTASTSRPARPFAAPLPPVVARPPAEAGRRVAGVGRLCAPAFLRLVPSTESHCATRLGQRVAPSSPSNASRHRPRPQVGVTA